MIRLLGISLFVVAGALADNSIPPGTLLEVRLQQEISSYSSKRGTLVQGVLVAPVRLDDRVVLPIGTKVTGTLQDVRRVGAGILFETAYLRINFDRIELLDGSIVTLASKVAEVDNGREKVDARGGIRGIRSTGTLAHKASGFFSAIAAADPLALAFTVVASSSLLRFSEPEIAYPAGTDLLVRVTEPLELPRSQVAITPMVTASPEEREELETLIQTLPYRTKSEKLNKFADVTNLVFLGRRSALERAFAAAGWVAADPLSGQTGFHALRSWTEAQGYHSGPMSTLLLDEHRPDYALSKSLNTFSKRHHLRIWPANGNWDGLQVWTSSSTQDVAIGITKRSRSLIHVIDEFIDGERAKVVNDLVYTGCVDGVQLVQRPWVPRETRNANGELIRTDGAVGVVRLNDCEDPHRSDFALAPPPGPSHGGLPLRFTRQVLLTARNNVVRGNLIYQSGDGIRLLVKAIRPPKSSSPNRRAVDMDGDTIVADGDEPMTTARSEDIRSQLPNELPAEMLSISPAPRVPTTRTTPRDPWAPPIVELGWFTGRLQAPATSVGSMVIRVTPRNAEPSTLIASNVMRRTWTAGLAVVIHTPTRISHELTFNYQRASFDLGLTAIDSDSADSRARQTMLVTRQASYNTQYSFRPPTSRIRPYISVGPALQLLHLQDAGMRSTSGLFRWGLRDIGIARSAYNYGNAPPLEGGGIFQAAVQYGGGVRARLTPRWTARFDYRETLSRQPDFWSQSISREDAALGETHIKISAAPIHGPWRQQRLSIGFNFTF